MKMKRSWRAGYADLSEDNQRFLRFIERANWTASLTLIGLNTALAVALDALIAGRPQAVWSALLTAALCIGTVLVLNRVLLNLAAQRVRERELARAAAEQAERLQGVLLAARTMQHHLNNQLTLTVGYSELLAADPDLPATARWRALTALRGAEEAAVTLQRLQRVTRLEEAPSIGGPTILDLDRSIPEAEDYWADEPRAGEPSEATPARSSHAA